MKESLPAEGPGSDPALYAKTKLTKRQQAILSYIRAAVAERGYPPSLREIGESVGLASPSSVVYQLKTLEDRGLVRRDPHRPRAMELRKPQNVEETALGNTAQKNTAQPVDAASTSAAPTAGLEFDTSRTTFVPVLGRIAAGGPILAEENAEDIYALPRDLVGEGELFLLKVVGESMIGAAICDGDFVAVRKQPDALSGDIVAALIDDEATVKTFKQENGQVWLMPSNPMFEPIPGNNARIMGKVVSVLRKI